MLLVSISVVVSIGYAIRFAQKRLLEWLNEAIGGLAYEVFWILLAVFFFPRAALRPLAIGFCLCTCGLEWLQLWHPTLLETARDLTTMAHSGQYLQSVGLSTLFCGELPGLAVGAIGAKVDMEVLSVEC